MSKPDDNEPITAEWLRSVGFDHEEEFGGDAGHYMKDLDDNTPDWITVSSSGHVEVITDDGKPLERWFSNRGRLRLLWLAITGKELA